MTLFGIEPQEQSKAALIRENLEEIKAMRAAGKSYPAISLHLSSKTGVNLGTGQIYSILIKSEARLEPGMAVIGPVLRLSPEKLNVLNADGTVHVLYAGSTLMPGTMLTIECKKWCCRKLEKYARYRGKLVIKWKVCPYCGSKR